MIGTFFLHVQSFWFDCKTGQDSLKEFVPVESSTTPLYNRKFTIGLDSTVGSSNVEGYTNLTSCDILNNPTCAFS